MTSTPKPQSLVGKMAASIKLHLMTYLMLLAMYRATYLPW